MGGSAWLTSDARNAARRDQVVSRRREPCGDKRRTNASGSGHAVSRTAHLLLVGVAWRCTTRARPSARRRLRCPRDLSRRLRTLATRAASSHSRARGPRLRDAGWRAQLSEAARRIVTRVEAWRAPCRRERHSRELVGVYLGSGLQIRTRARCLTCPPAAIASRTAGRRRGFRRCIRHQGNHSNSGCGTRLPRDRGS